MIYRNFGKTGDKISQISFGCMRLPEYEKDGKYYIDEEKAIPMLQYAYEQGINYFDSALIYSHGNNQRIIGKALKDVRSRVLYSTKVLSGHIEKTDDFMRILDRQLKDFETSYIDYYHLHSLNISNMRTVFKKYGVLDDLRRAIDQKMIRHASFSFHDKPKNLAAIIDYVGFFSSALVQYNFLNRSNEEGIEYAASRGLGVVVMGPVAGGRLTRPSHLNEKLFNEKVSSPELALRFVLGNKNVSSALSGMDTMEVLKSNLKVGNIKEPMTEKDFEKIKTLMEEYRSFSDLYCTGCNYCMPCPQNINIPYIFSCYTFINVYGLVDVAREMYDRVGTKIKHYGEKPDNCVLCGYCEKKCPQDIKIIKKLKIVDERFNTHQF